MTTHPHSIHTRKPIYTPFPTPSLPVFHPKPTTFINTTNNTNIFKLTLLFISMATSLLLICALFFLSVTPYPSFAHRTDLSSGGAGTAQSATFVIQQACRGTRYPDACQSMLAGSGRLGPNATTVDVIQAAFAASAGNLDAGQGMVKGILDDSARDHNRSRAAETCLEVLAMSEHRTNAAVEALSRGKLRDARAWASAALAYEYGCWSGLKYVNNSAAVNSTMSFFDTTVIVSTSNALSLLRALDALGPDTASWTPPRTERDGFWEPVVGSQTGPGSPTIDVSTLTADATVCNDGSGGCTYKSVQEAVDAAPENLEGKKRFVIKIKEGVYDEIVRVAFNKTNLVFVGDGMGKTVITGDLSIGLKGINTYNTATVG